MSKRLTWVDQTKGLGIFLMIYAHNFPITETYIYTFHMPLFFVVAGMFHPKNTTLKSISNRAKRILIPYFIWSLLLYVFWYFLGRHYGNSVGFNLNPIDNLIGVFYAQGDNAYMNWGIPMWFLPCIFLSYLFFALVKSLNNKIVQSCVLIVLISFGFLYPQFFEFKLPWSIDVACVSLIFYAAGSFIKTHLSQSNSKTNLWYLGAMIVIHFSLAFLNTKVDMYRSDYGNELLFIVNGFSGTLVALLLFKAIKAPSFLSYLGKNTIPLLALQGRALTVIKFVLLSFGVTAFNFSEPTKFALAILQILLILPIIIIVNRYVPILNGGIKK